METTAQISGGSWGKGGWFGEQAFLGGRNTFEVCGDCLGWQLFTLQYHQERTVGWLDSKGVGREMLLLARAREREGERGGGSCLALSPPAVAGSDLLGNRRETLSHCHRQFWEMAGGSSASAAQASSQVSHRALRSREECLGPKSKRELSSVNVPGKEAGAPGRLSLGREGGREESASSAWPGNEKAQPLGELQK